MGEMLRFENNYSLEFFFNLNHLFNAKGCSGISRNRSWEFYFFNQKVMLVTSTIEIERFQFQNVFEVISLIIEWSWSMPSKNSSDVRF